MRSALGTLHGGLVIHMTRKFHDPVMYFDADRARNHVLFLTKLSEDVLLNLHVVCHQPTPSLFTRECQQASNFDQLPASNFDQGGLTL
jgi:hypothetical protein